MYHLLGLDPLAVDAVEPLQVDNLKRKYYRLWFGSITLWTYQYRRQFPDLQLLGGGFLALAVTAVVPLLQFLFGGKGAQAMVEVNGLHLLPSAYGNGFMVHPQLKYKWLLYHMQGVFGYKTLTRSKVLW